MAAGAPVKAGVAPAELGPPLKWAGGKRWLVPHLRPLWEGSSASRLVEPLCGGLAVALGLKPQQALLNDINPHNINFYTWLKRGLRIGIELENDSGLYYGHRSRFNDLIAGGKASSREAAELFYYLNKTGYNGLCRFNRSGQFNVPFGRHGRIGYKRDLRAYKALLSAWAFSSGDFAALDVQPGDFIYADPPYDVEFRHYSKDGFTWEDQERLVEWLVQHDGPTVISNQATDRVLKLYSKHGFTLEFYEAPRMISRTGDRSKAREVLARKGV